jgi:hypothetical protein
MNQAICNHCAANLDNLPEIAIDGIFNYFQEHLPPHEDVSDHVQDLKNSMCKGCATR